MKTLLHIALFLVLPLFPAMAESDTPSRPKVGLVLGGGGALGLSHIGVLKVLEENRIPVDYIAGTSMGSIIAGLYASGMAPGEIESFLESLNWDDVLSDATPRRELFFRRKFEDQRFLFEVGLGRNGIKVGTGMAAGQKFNNLMQYITLRVAGVTNFNDFSIPYRAVATDLASGKPFVIDRGNLGLAMRASMAVPGVFTPMEWNGHVLVDGGVVDNLPVDVVKAMGADVIIAVDVGSSSDHVDPRQFASLGGILGRTYAIAQRPRQLEQFARADIGIQPDLDGMTASQFARVADFIPRGEAAAQAHADALRALSVPEDSYRDFLARHRKPMPEGLMVTDVQVTGNQRVATPVMEGRIRTRPGQPLDFDTVQLDLMRMYGVGEFERILFTLEPTSPDGGRVTYDAREKASGPLYFKYGLNLSTDFDNASDWAMLLNLTRMSINDLGAEWRNDMQVGSVLDLFSEFYQPLDAGGVFFVAPNIQYRSDIEDIYDGKQRVAEYDVTSVESRLDLGVQLRHYAEFRTGPWWGTGRADVETGSTDLPELDEDFAGWSVGLVVDRQDRTVFARDGYFFSAQASFARESFGGDRDFEKGELEARSYHSVGDHTAALGVRAGSAFNSDLPEYASLTLGGPFNFAGLAEDQFRGSYLGVGTIEYRYRLATLPAQLGRAIFTTMRFDAGNVWPDEFDTGDLRYGGSVGLGVDSAAGPIYAGYGRAEGGYDLVYLSLGTAF